MFACIAYGHVAYSVLWAVLTPSLLLLKLQGQQKASTPPGAFWCVAMAKIACQQQPHLLAWQPVCAGRSHARGSIASAYASVHRQTVCMLLVPRSNSLHLLLCSTVPEGLYMTCS